MFLNNRLLKKSKGKQKNSRNKWQWKHNSNPMVCSKSSSKREVYSNTILPQEARKTSNRQPFSQTYQGKKREESYQQE